ncbi:hypothetical protein AK812_SmicGene10657 [Symbiodinium microadriaticum]|uniref:Uncharacterized protein n=1 Tax=Symbiodinium microadriaticum TaxID=2951 RepID=A0A1Q9EF84_SYMMI|nr:hypothetical protein AK812_SmicGene10657 [Symbiodinium microadriaticum]
MTDLAAVGRGHAEFFSSEAEAPEALSSLPIGVFGYRDTLEPIRSWLGASGDRVQQATQRQLRPQARVELQQEEDLE